MIDFNHCVGSIITKCKCSADEAWSALNTAFLTLDQSLPEAAQYWWLINIGVFNVYDTVRKTYTSIDSGLKREVLVDITDIPDESSADDEDWDFLHLFKSDLAREYAVFLCESGRKFTMESVRHWLRKTHGINSRTTTRRVHYEVLHVAKKIQDLG